MSNLFHAILKQQFPGVEREYKFHDSRKWKFDFAWPRARIALEIEGGTWISGRHNRGYGFIKDMEKYSEAAILGWCVIRVTPQQIQSGMAINLVDRALTIRGYSAQNVINQEIIKIQDVAPVLRPTRKISGKRISKKLGHIYVNGRHEIQKK